MADVLAGSDRPFVLASGMVGLSIGRHATENDGLVPTDMIRAMATGAVVVDVAADSGGNCEPTRAGETVDVDGTAVVGMSNPPSGMPTHASVLYARNVLNLLDLLVADGVVAPHWDDEVVAGCCLLRDGQPGNDAVAELLGLPLAEPGSGGAA